MGLLNIFTCGKKLQEVSDDAFEIERKRRLKIASDKQRVDKLNQLKRMIELIEIGKVEITPDSGCTGACIKFYLDTSLPESLIANFREYNYSLLRRYNK